MKVEVWSKVRSTAADLFGVDAGSLSAETGPDRIANWDSVQHLNLVLTLEEQFKLQFTPEEMDRMDTLGEIAQVVANRLQTLE